MADGKVVIDTSLNNTGLKNGIKNIDKSINEAKVSIGKLGAAIGIAFGVKALVSFGRECVEIGSNIAEVQNVVDVAFGNMAYKIEEFSNNSIQQFGMSRLSAKKTASTYMAMARGMGIQEEAASDMAVALTGLTGDVASFYNISQDLADVKLKSVFTGETETLKDLGIVMTQANLQAYALSAGINKSISEMTQAELVGLRYNYVVEQLNLASGDFARTQNSWANQTRILQENWKEFMSVLGEGLIQVLTPVLRVLNQIVTSLINAANVCSKALSTLFGSAGEEIQSVGAATSHLNSEIMQSADGAQELEKNTKAAGKAAKTAAMGFDQLNILSDTGDSDKNQDYKADVKIPTAISAEIKSDKSEKDVSKLADNIINTVSKVKAYFDKHFTPSVKAWGEAFGKLDQPVKAAMSKVKGATNGVVEKSLKPLSKYTKDEFVPNIVNSFSENFAPIFSDVATVAVDEFAKDYEFMCAGVNAATNDFVLPAMRQYETVATDVFDGVGVAWEKHGKNILDGFQRFKESLRKIWSNIYNNIIKPVFERIFEVADWLWDKHLKPLWDNLTDFFGSLCECILAVWNNFIAPVLNKLISVLAPTITSVINRITDVIGTIIAVVADVISGVIKSLKGILDFITGVFTGNWEKAWNGIKDFVCGIWNGIWGVIKGVINLIIDGLNGLWSGVYSIFAGIANGIGGAVGWIGGILGKDWSFSLPSKPPAIPKLAQGAVIPPNREFLAVLGDQKNGTNIEAPLDTIIQAIKAAFPDPGGGTTDVHFTIELDGDVLYKGVKRAEAKRGNIYSNPALAR